MLLCTAPEPLRPGAAMLISIVALCTIVLALRACGRRARPCDALLPPSFDAAAFAQSSVFGLLVGVPLKSILIFARDHNANVAYALLFPTMLLAQGGACYVGKALGRPTATYAFSEWTGLLVGAIVTWKWT